MNADNLPAATELARLSDWLTATRRDLEMLEKAGDVSPEAANGARAMLRAFEREVVKGERTPAAPRWIPTTEELPAEGEEVLVWVVPPIPPHAGYCDCAGWTGTDWKNEVGDWAGDVRAWQPLPPGPPEEGEEEAE